MLREHVCARSVACRPRAELRAEKGEAQSTELCLHCVGANVVFGAGSAAERAECAALLSFYVLHWERSRLLGL